MSVFNVLLKGRSARILVCALIYSFCSFSYAQDRVCFEGNCINVEVVEQLEDLKRGLQFRQFLGKDEGMLFSYSTSWQAPIWMKNTLIPLDIIWMDDDKRIVSLVTSAPPCKSDPCQIYRPDRPARYVLEVNSEYADRQGLRVGDQAEFLLTGEQ